MHGRHRLTDSKVRSLTRPGVHSDGDGLYLRVQPTGTRSWVFIWKRFGIRNEMGLGAYGSGARHVSLSAARAKAEEARGIIGNGGDPRTDMAERKAAITQSSFGKIADEYIEVMKPKWRSDKTLAAWNRFANGYSAAIRRVPVDKITTDDVLRVLRPLWNEKPETAAKVQNRLKVVLDHAKARKLRQGDNPAQWRGLLDQILPAPPRLARGHHAALPYTEIAALIGKLRAAGGVGARALEFAILTAARSGEVRGAKWSEIDLDAKLWVIPGSRMKQGREHRVPLAGRAVEILREMKERAVDDFVFPSAKQGAPLSDMTVAKALKTAGAGAYTVHGMRSAFRDFAGEETGFPREVAGAALAHAVGDQVEQAYRRGDALAKRRRLMSAWADYCDPAKRGGSNVVPMGARRG